MRPVYFIYKGWEMQRIIITVAIFLLIAGGAVGWLHNHISQYDSLIMQAAARHELDFFLVKALIFEESWFRADIRGSSGELGLMQITMAAASDFTSNKGFSPLDELHLLEPALNVEIGCWYLRHSLENYKDSPHPVLFALLRYNAGKSRADNWLKQALASPTPAGMSEEDYYLSLVDFDSTQAYATNILQRYRSRNFWF